jgi:hypothetical protein
VWTEEGKLYLFVAIDPCQQVRLCGAPRTGLAPGRGGLPSTAGGPRALPDSHGAYG